MNKKLDWEPKAFLFDFEGTLVTFEWNLKEGIKATLKEITSNGYSLQKLKKNPSYVDIHNFVSEIKEQNEKSTLFNNINNIFDQYDEDALSRWTLSPGAKSTIKNLKKKKIPVGLVTNVGLTAIQGAIISLGLENLFDIIITRNDLSRLKPNPEGLIKASSTLKIDMESILFVGDSFDDLGAAHSAGIKSCYIAGGQDILAIDYPIKPLFTIDSLHDLINYF